MAGNPLRVGAVIRVTDSDGMFYHVGDTAVICHSDGEGGWWANFNNRGNPHVVEGGIWCVAVEAEPFGIEAYTEDDPEDLLP